MLPAAATTRNNERKREACIKTPNGKKHEDQQVGTENPRFMTGCPAKLTHFRPQVLIRFGSCRTCVTTCPMTVRVPLPVQSHTPGVRSGARSHSGPRILPFRKHPIFSNDRLHSHIRLDRTDAASSSPTTQPHRTSPLKPPNPPCPSRSGRSGPAAPSPPRSPGPAVSSSPSSPRGSCPAGPRLPASLPCART